jgi:hypothetical protein
MAAGVLVFAAQTFDGLFLLIDFTFRRQRLDVDRDLIVEEIQARQPVDDPRIGAAGPPLERENRLVASIEIKPDFLQTDAVRVPAVLLNREPGIKPRSEIHVEAIRKRRIQELRAVAEVREIVHRRHRCIPAEDRPERPGQFLELSAQLTEKLFVICFQPYARFQTVRVAGDRRRDEEHELLTP